MRRVLFGLIALFILAADQLSKQWVAATLPQGKQIAILPPIVYAYHTTNDGVAWSLFRGHAGIMSAVAVLFCITIVYVGRRAILRSTLLAVALGLLLGGAAGNLIDRARLGYVIDFIDVYIGRFYRWPTFNVADSAITTGMILMVIYFWLNESAAGESGGAGSEPVSQSTPVEAADNVSAPVAG